MRAHRAVVSSLALLAALTSGCGRGETSARSSAVGPGAASGDVLVFAASSLTEALTQIAVAFTSANPAVGVSFNFAGSGELVTQIEQGAPADAFVSADDTTMARLVGAGEAAGEPVSIATNTMAIIVEPGNPKRITSVADLADPDLIVVLCAATVPCGKGAATILANAAVEVTPSSLEDSVKGVVTKVELGEADAGIVFATDVKGAGDDAVGVVIPASVNVINHYPMVVTAASRNPEAAQAFIDFVAGPAGQAMLGQYGFLAP
ncbi:MAG: molybdate ABC transporter substrate-binding protein [Actinomycetota bacterium]